MTTTTNDAKIDFGALPYCQCAHRVSGEAAIRDRVGWAYDPALDWSRVCFFGPVYGTERRLFCCVPIDAAPGDRIVSCLFGDSAERATIYEVIAVDDAVGEERGPWSPLRPTRRAVVKRVATGRARMDRQPNER